MVFAVQQGVGVTDHAGTGVVPGDGQRIAQGRRTRLREAGDIAAADHGNAANSQGLQTIRGSHGEAARVG
ncbi:hypothetical protein D3C81_1047510 [compost metagenome]